MKEVNLRMLADATQGLEVEFPVRLTAEARRLMSTLGVTAIEPELDDEGVERSKQHTRRSEERGLL